MNKTKIRNHDFFYFDSDDQIISDLKSNKLYGLGNYLAVKELISDGEEYIIDCGAHIGTFSFVPALENKNILMIEAAGSNVACLRSTFKNFKNTIVEQAIVLDEIQNCNFDSEYGPYGNASICSDGKKVSNTIDNLCDKHNINKVSAIKIDIEGYEEEAILGAKKTIQNNKPILYLEINSYCLFTRKQEPEKILRRLDELGYSIFFQYKNRLIPISPRKLFPFCVVDVICIHKDKINNFYKKNNFSRYLTDKELKDIRNIQERNSNEQCREYFDYRREQELTWEEMCMKVGCAERRA